MSVTLLMERNGVASGILHWEHRNVWIVAGIPFLVGLICLIDILRNEFTGHNKIIWLVVVLFLPLLGAALYFFIGTDQKIRPEDDEEPVVRLI